MTGRSVGEPSPLSVEGDDLSPAGNEDLAVCTGVDNVVDNDMKGGVMQQVAGHGLVQAGAAHGRAGCREVVCLAMGDRRISSGGGGHAVCECGERSAHLDSNRLRREWHRQHKRKIDVEQTRDPGGMAEPEATLL